MPKQPFNTRLRFSLRMLFVVMSILCLLLGLWSIYIDPFRQQARSMAALEQYDARVKTRPASGSAWQCWLVRTVIGEHAFVEVEEINVQGPKFDDEALQKLSGLKRLESLRLEQTNVTDAGLSTLREMRNLEELSLSYTPLTNRGVADLNSSPKLTSLKLTGTQIDDAAVAQLSKLTSLKELYIRWTHISDDGAERLRESLPSCAVHHQVLRGSN